MCRTDDDARRLTDHGGRVAKWWCRPVYSHHEAFRWGYITIVWDSVFRGMPGLNDIYQVVSACIPGQLSFINRIICRVIFLHSHTVMLALVL